jgi:hypothetical protein
MPAAAASRPTKRCDKCGACRLPSDALNCAPAETRLLWPGRLRDERQRGPSRSRSDRCGLDAGRQSRQAREARQERRLTESWVPAPAPAPACSGAGSGFRIAHAPRAAPAIRPRKRCTLHARLSRNHPLGTTEGRHVSFCKQAAVGQPRALANLSASRLLDLMV